MSPRRVIYHTWTAADRERLKALVDAEQQTAKETRWTLRSPEYQEFTGDAPQPEFAQGMFMQRME